MRGVIAAGDPQTAAAGAAQLRQGGNAVDAAVAAAFASFVAEAVLVNIGGGGMATLAGADGAVAVYDFFSDMPSGALAAGADFREIHVDFGSETQPFYIGRASVAVPGVVAGLCRLAAACGTLPLQTLLEPAVQLAADGATLSPALEYVLDILSPIFTDTPGLAALVQPHGHLCRAGERMLFPQLGATLAGLAAEGPELFYHGRVGQAIVADQRRHGGLVTTQDLADYRVHRCEPIRITYRDAEINLPSAPSSGGVLIGLALEVLAGMDVGALAHNEFDHVRLLAETMRLTSEARRSLDTADADLLSEAHVGAYRARLQDMLSDAVPARPSPEPRGPRNTTHISVADESGNVVSLTTSAGENAGFVVGDTGVFLNNMLGEIDLHPNGFHRLPPGQRLQTMMSPVIVTRAGAPVLAVGSGGSNRLRSAILQVISNVLDFGLPLQAAINAPRVHFEVGVLQLEGGIAPRVAARCAEVGYEVNLWPARNMFFGGAHAVARQGGEMVAAGDARRGGAVAVVD
ncbi:MAG: gamma-glutamyltransferase family protein [Anaerolineales bacterium]